MFGLFAPDPRDTPEDEIRAYFPAPLIYKYRGDTWDDRTERWIDEQVESGMGDLSLYLGVWGNE